MTIERLRPTQGIRINITSTMPIPVSLVGLPPVLHRQLQRLWPPKLPHGNVTIDHPPL